MDEEQPGWSTNVLIFAGVGRLGQIQAEAPVQVVERKFPLVAQVDDPVEMDTCYLIAFVFLDHG